MKKALLLLCFIATIASAQLIQLDMSVFAERREAFMKKMEPNSAAIFPCKPEYLRNLDVEYEYRQESNFYYLSAKKLTEYASMPNSFAGKMPIHWEAIVPLVSLHCQREYDTSAPHELSESLDGR